MKSPRMRSTLDSEMLSGSTVLPAHRVLFITELLDIIFNFLDRDTNVTNACVCKRWSEIALDVVWKEVDDLLDLFRLLKPISFQLEYVSGLRLLLLCQTPTSSSYLPQCFDTLPEASDWSRFEKYASRVRSFKFREATCDLDIYSLLDDVARTRTSLEILPNMHTLEWIYTSPAYMERCKLFLHRRLRHLSVTAPSQLPPRLDFYTDLCARAPHLRTLSLLSASPAYLSTLSFLNKIVLPEFHYTSAVVEELSRAKNIAVVDFSQDLKLGFGNPSNVASFAPVLKEGAFPCLRELNLSARIDDLDRFFRSSFAPIHITTLYVNSYTDHTPTEVHTLLVTLSQQCQLLSKLNLQLYHKVLPSNLPPDQQLSYDTLKPILTFPNLSSFELVHKYPLKITLDELEDLASKWPNLECLMLNAEPLFLNEDALTLDLRALLPFARHCPRLRTLGLYINATEAEIPSSYTPLEPFSTAFHTLSVGTSQVRDTSAVATFLSRIFPPRCNVEMGITWTEFGREDDRSLPVDLRYPLQKRCVGWQAVEKLLPALIQLRREEKERSRALQEEVEDLRVRNRLLTDKADTNTKDSCIIV
ncbi:hypothetical protein J3R83DRAFT_9064 [Lanmaoa asiatica]|nr:hypothetical protein J3R83DRAFT_9064 [Lanmaoa asiatica]